MHKICYFFGGRNYFFGCESSIFSAVDLKEFISEYLNVLKRKSSSSSLWNHRGSSRPTFAPERIQSFDLDSDVNTWNWTLGRSLSESVIF